MSYELAQELVGCFLRRSIQVNSTSGPELYLVLEDKLGNQKVMRLFGKGWQLPVQLNLIIYPEALHLGIVFQATPLISFLSGDYGLIVSCWGLHLLTEGGSCVLICRTESGSPSGDLMMEWVDTKLEETFLQVEINNQLRKG